MAERLVITKDNGEKLTVEFVCAFAIPQMQKQFLISTMNEIDPNGLVILNVSEIQNKKLLRVNNDDDWSRIKQVMRSIISSSAGEFKYLPYFANVNSDIDYARNISVQGVAKDQLVRDYTEKKPVGDETTSGGAQTLVQPDEPLVDVPMNPALGNVGGPVGFGESEVAPGIVEVGKNNPNDAITDFTPVSVTEKPIDLVAPGVGVGGGINQQPVAQVANPQMSQQPVQAPTMNMTSQPVVQQPMMQQNNLPQTPQVTMNQMPNNQVMQQQPMMQQNMLGNSTTNNSVGMNFDQVVNEAREVFIESAKNLAEVIIANAFETIKKKEEELRNREIIVAQREAAINQQTMMSMGQMQYNSGMGMQQQPMMQQQMNNPYNNYSNQ